MSSSRLTSMCWGDAVQIQWGTVSVWVRDQGGGVEAK